MERSISAFCGALASFLDHVESSSHSLAQSLQRRPIPLDSVATSFLQGLNARVSSASTDLELLDSMAFGTVSFEELLGHCGEVYKKNQSYISQIEDLLKSFGYVPEYNLDDELDLDVSPENVSVCALHSVGKSFGENDIFDESMSLENLGLSDACLATLASEAKAEPRSLMISSGDLASFDKEMEKKMSQPSLGEFDGPEKLKDPPVSEEGTGRDMLKISKDDYNRLPSYMMSLASWEDLLEAVTKMNSQRIWNDGGKGSCSFCENDLEKLGLGRKGRTYLLLLLRMNRLTMEKVGDSTIYRVQVNS